MKHGVRLFLISLITLTVSCAIDSPHNAQQQNTVMLCNDLKPDSTQRLIYNTNQYLIHLNEVVDSINTKIDARQGINEGHEPKMNLTWYKHDGSVIAFKLIRKFYDEYMVYHSYYKENTCNWILVSEKQYFNSDFTDYKAIYYFSDSLMLAHLVKVRVKKPIRPPNIYINVTYNEQLIYTRERLLEHVQGWLNTSRTFLN